MTLRFGTDGLRGVAGSELTAELAVSLGRAAARRLGQSGGNWIIGRDTRRSGPMLQAALAAGLAAEGVNVVDLGVIPTPGVAALAAAYGAPGAMVSASHNPFADNGIKLFATGGRKLTDAVEAELEADLLRGPTRGPSGLAVGEISTDPDGLGWYQRQVTAGIEGRSLHGIRVVVDCGHGAAAVTAGPVLEAAGADVVDRIGVTPDGTNINAGCGSTDPSALAASVVAHQAAAGLAFDGDADRVIAVDGDGQVVDGDRLLAIFATDLQRRGRLAGDTVAVTVMTNLGFHQAMAASGILVHQTDVGDRYVLEALDAHGWSLGGEQSGHLVFRDLATTGDGVLSGLMLLDVLARSGRPLADLAGAVMQRLPQVLRNVQVADRDGIGQSRDVWTAVRAAEAALGDGGRVLLRPSGTERLVRVMVEAATEDEAAGHADRLAAVVRASLGTPA